MQIRFSETAVINQVRIPVRVRVKRSPVAGGALLRVIGSGRPAPWGGHDNRVLPCIKNPVGKSMGKRCAGLIQSAENDMQVYI
jgi:hypothetical protein